MIILCTDYLRSVYTGQVESRILSIDPQIKVIRAIDDLPTFNAKASAYLLNVLVSTFPKSSVVVAVVDPGVGSDRIPIAFFWKSRWFVGPDNGIFSRILMNPDRPSTIYEITQTESNVSRTFHGRDVFAPAAVRLAQNDCSHLAEISPRQLKTFEYCSDWSEDLYEIIYIDGFFNCMTGIFTKMLHSSAIVQIGDVEIRHAETFAVVNSGEVFWYVNSIGLVEIAAYLASAAIQLNVNIGDSVFVR